MPTSPLAAGPTAPLGAESIGVLQAALFTGASPRGTAELVVMMTHHPEVTHLDSLVHQVVTARCIRGSRWRKPAAWQATGTGPPRCSGRAWSPAASSPIWPRTARCQRAMASPAELEAACARAGSEVRSGDALVVRGGWDYAASRDRHIPGMTLDAVAWMHRHDVAVYAGDIGHGRPPVDPCIPGPLHRVALARLGMPLIGVADPTGLAAACAEQGRATFLFVAAPPRLGAASGVPVNPIAIF
jgi:hypothetical protein